MNTAAIFATSYRASQTRHNAPDLTPAQMENAAYIIAALSRPAQNIRKGFYIYGADRATRICFAEAIRAVCDTAQLPNSFSIGETAKDGNIMFLEFDPAKDAGILAKRHTLKIQRSILTFATSAVAPGEFFNGLTQHQQDCVKVLFESMIL